MLREETTINVDELLAEAQRLQVGAMALHPYYRGKIETSIKCTVRDFAIWYTPGVAAPRRTVAQDPDKVYDHTSVMNAEFIAQPPN